MNLLVCKTCSAVDFIKINPDEDKCERCGTVHSKLDDYRPLILENLSEEQVRMMRHALGINDDGTPYRNYYYTYKEVDEWEDLVGKGFATRKEGHTKGDCIYALTHGAVIVVSGQSILFEEYSKL